MAAISGVLEAEGGEHTQTDVGPHREFGVVPINLDQPPAGMEHNLLWETIVKSFADADLTSLPPKVDWIQEVCLYTGTHKPGAMISLARSAADGANVHSDPETAHVAAVSASWELLDSYRLRPGEKVLVLREILLARNSSGVAGSAGGLIEPYLVVGTGIITARGEDAPPEGRLLVFRIVTAADGRGVETGTASRLSLAFETDVKGAVTSLAPLIAKDQRHVVVGWNKQLQAGLA
jgi:hypothetical protein